MATEARLMLHVLRGDFEVPVARAGAGAGDGAEMDERVWSGLPKDVLGKVLQKLPYAVKVRFRAVSRAWRNDLLSDSALRSSASASASGARPICALEFVDADREASLRCELPRRVCDLELSFLPPECSRWSSTDFFVQQGLVGVLLPAPDPDRRPQVSSLAICLLNPMTRTWRKLPELSFADPRKVWDLWNEGQQWRIKLEVDRRCSSTSDLRIELVLLLPGSIWEEFGAVNMSVSAVCMYSSSTDEWTVTKCVDDHAFRSFPRALCNGLIYTLNYHQWLTTHSLSDGRLRGAFDLQTLQSSPGELSSSRPFLVEHHGDVLCVQELCRVSASPTFGIWKLNPITMRWSELSMLPKAVLDRFVAQMHCSQNNEYGLSSVKTVGEFVCLSVYSRVIMPPDSAPVLVHLLVCHIPTRRWRLGFNNLLHLRSQSRFELFEPRLDIFL
ncbi:hypothetical protein MPTK1_5g06210 [Marchantia polymorpha subsp. ruderalis]|uniref:F-box domain-containing protein n=2 Tax=Marchantia polymorpha TaxID=3197 RepID=A0AAF6BFH9_MARPO|nr:hypothetical protein MARPO_0027s0007 [Marchantia polymorpha]BBN10763.1 hypothetical protein Mp_5g06210 [Marchantia polymorpha subsp. ruderalis]|eukprot:PTQ42871.1 hypothetical protein MARPO_0027s0007 [Marchantia polymorpha]